MKRRTGIELLALLFLGTAPLLSAPVAFTDESAFLAALVARGDCIVVESFESELAWGAVRTTIVGGIHTAPTVVSQGISWLPNGPDSEVTTGEGPARTGAWGFFELPHGDYLDGFGDGFVVTTDSVFSAAGGWIETNTPFAAIDFLLDGTTVVDFEDVPLGAQYQFYGVVEAAGLQRLEVRELEGAIDDQKYIFADDFTFGFAPTCPGLLFADGFEAGLGAWSEVVQ